MKFNLRLENNGDHTLICECGFAQTLEESRTSELEKWTTEAKAAHKNKGLCPKQNT